jgi:hypothetical protein
MILNSRQNGFLLNLPSNFFNDQVKQKYVQYYRSLLLPYRSLDDFMSSTIQSVNFPGFSSTLPTQTRILGKTQELQSAKPIADQFSRDLKITFKLTDAYLNYFIFLDNALNYLEPANVAPENVKRSSLGQALSVDPISNENHPYFDPIRLTLLNNEGYSVSSIIFNRPMLISLSEMNLSYSSISPQFVSFTATFKYYNFDLELDFD